MSSPPPTVLDILPADILRKVMIYVGTGHYRYVAGSCRGFREAYKGQHPDNYLTSKESIVGSVQTAEFYIADKKMVSATTKPPRKKKPRTQAPRSSQEEDLRRFNVACWAARYGELDTLKWIQNQHRFEDSNVSQILDQAAQEGHIDCFNFLFEEGEKDVDLLNPCYYFTSAAQYGRLTFLRHFKEKLISLNAELCRVAAQHGQLEVLKFTHEEVSPCPSYIYDRAFVSAAWRGHLGCLVYLHSTLGARIQASHAIRCIISQNVDNHECLRYIIENYDGNLHWEQDRFLKQSLQKLAFHGHHGCLAYLLQLQNVNWDNRDFEAALENSARFGHLECLSCLLELDNHVWSNAALDNALISSCSSCRGGSPDCLAYLLDLDRNWSATVIHQAVEHAVMCESFKCLGHLLKVDGVDWDREQLSRLFKVAKHGLRNADCAGCLRAFLSG